MVMGTRVLAAALGLVAAASGWIIGSALEPATAFLLVAVLIVAVLYNAARTK